MKMKKIVAVVSVLLIAFAVYAKGSKDAAASSSSSGDKPAEITIMCDSTVFTKANGREAFQAEFEKLSGIKLNIVQPDHDAYYDVLGQTIASGDWPDVVLLNETYYAGYAGEGVLVDITDYYDNSSLKSRMSMPQVQEGIRIDGKLYGISPASGNGCVTYIKKAWLDNCNLEVPTTYAEYLKVLDAFTNGDPDADGVMGNTYAQAAAGLIGNESPYINYLPDFYQDAYPAFIKENGKWIDGFTKPAMEGALQRLKDAYEAGYLDRETLTNGTKDCRNKFYDDKYGIFTYWAGYWNENLKNGLEANGYDGTVIPLAPLKETGSYIDRIAPTWAITAKCENPEAVFKYFIESMLDGDKMQYLWTYGVEGVHWSTKAETVCGNTYAEGEWHGLESLEKPGTQYKKNHINPHSPVVDLKGDPRLDSIAPETVNSANIFAANSRPAVLVPSTEEMATYNGDLTTLKREIVAQVVTQGMSVADGMAMFENEGGAKWSKLIVDSLNK